jgi:hypothetical protein
MKKLEIRIVLAASRTAIIGNYILRRLKCSRIEVVVPKEEEEQMNGVGSTRKGRVPPPDQ